MPKFTLGEEAPDFTLRDQNGNLVSLSDYREKSNVVLFFYPKDFSSGCTAEVCGFRNNYEAFTNMDAVVIGVSGDSVESHKRFLDKHILPFTLLSDPKRKIQFQYGATKAFGIFPGRYTFIIDKGGVIRRIFTSEINMKIHIDEALKGLSEITG